MLQSMESKRVGRNLAPEPQEKRKDSEEAKEVTMHVVHNSPEARGLRLCISEATEEQLLIH